MEEKLGANSNVTQEKYDWESCFEELEDKFVDELIETIKFEYSEHPTQVQLEAIQNYILKKKQNKNKLFLIKAPGGSGKTLSFSIPAVISAIRSYKADHQYHSFETKQKNERGKTKNVQVWRYHPKIIILADTKVLVEQISDELGKLIPESFKDKIRVTQIYSGKTSTTEIGSFEHILVATPYIINTLMNAQDDHLYVDQADLMIIDEAECVYEGNKDQLQQIIQKLEQESKADLICASATLNKEFKQFSQTTYKKNDEDTVQVTYDLKLSGVKQFSVELPGCENEKQEMEQVFGEIVKLLKSMYIEQRMDSQVMIFTDSIRYIDKLNEALLSHKDLTQGTDKMEFNVIHSKLVTKDGKALARENNKEMIKIYQNFRNNKFKLLICTDIMARGIDIKNCGLVINVFPPRVNITDQQSKINGPKYMHRIARTGRHAQKGVSLTYYRHPKRGDNTQFEISDRELPEQLNQSVESLTDNMIDQLNIAGDYIIQTLKNAQEAVTYNHNLK